MCVCTQTTQSGSISGIMHSVVYACLNIIYTTWVLVTTRMHAGSAHPMSLTQVGPMLDSPRRCKPRCAARPQAVRRRPRPHLSSCTPDKWTPTGMHATRQLEILVFSNLYDKKYIIRARKWLLLKRAGCFNFARDI